MTAPIDPPLIDPDGRPVGAAEIEAAMARIAPFYELDMGALADDLPLYREYARTAGPAVLEVGVGTGRVAAHLAAAGCRVVGIDASPAMLAQARERFADPAAGVTVVHADIRRPAPHPALAAGAFDLVIVPLAGLCHLLTRGDQLDALRNVARLLRPGGWFVADLPAFVPGDWSPELATPRLQWTRTDPRSGHTVMKFAASDPAPAIQIQWITYLYDETRSDGVVHRTLARFPLRHIFRFELEGLLETAGLRPERCFASYDLDDLPPHDAGERLIAVARKPAGAPG